MNRLSRLVMIGFLVVPSLLVVGCGREVGIPAADSGGGSIVAGHGEKSFSERYASNLKLPMPEGDFISLLHALKLPYESCGIKGSGLDVPVALHKNSVDLKNVVKCYVIYGDVSHEEKVGKSYRAFVDDKGNVVYIENTFSYTGL